MQPMMMLHQKRQERAPVGRQQTTSTIVCCDVDNDQEEDRRQKEVEDEDQQILDAIVIEDDEGDNDNERQMKQRDSRKKATKGMEAPETGQELDFLDVILKSDANVRKGNELLLKAVRTFEQQFSSGQIEGVVFNNLNFSISPKL